MRRLKKILYEYRGAHFGRHQGTDKTDTAIKGKYAWHSMKQEIEEHRN